MLWSQYLSTRHVVQEAVKITTRLSTTSARASMASRMEPAMGINKLSYEIFSILESKFLFGCHESPKSLHSASLKTQPPAAGPGGKVRILSIDGGGHPSDALFAAASLARLESAVCRRSGDSSARIADFFDVAAGSGAGGVLAAMLFTRGPNGRPLFAADEALTLFVSWSGRSPSGSFGLQRKSALGWLIQRNHGKLLRSVFGNATLKDTLKPVLIPCYDLATGAPFLFSRADAVEAEGFDFRIQEVCAATCTDPASSAAAIKIRSIDGRTRIVAVGGGVAMRNPAAAAVTHVLNNKQEFPFTAGMDDLMLLSIGSSTASADGAACRSWRRPVPPAAELVRIAGEGAADMVDQALAMAFGESRANNYLRIQANGFGSGNSTSKRSNVKELICRLEEKLERRNIESLLFRGKKISEQSNAQKLDLFAGVLIKEDEKRKKSLIPVVVFKQAMRPRTSSTMSSALTSTTSTSPSL